METVQVVAVLLWIALFVRIGWALVKPTATGLPVQLGVRRA